MGRTHRSRKRRRSGPFKRWFRTLSPWDKKSFVAVTLIAGLAIIGFLGMWAFSDSIEPNSELGTKRGAKSLFQKIFGREPTESEKAPFRPYFEK